MDCCFSLLQPYQLLTVEIPAGPQEFREASWADTCVYDCTRDRLHRLSVTRIPLPSHPVSCSRHPSETTLLLGLSDSSLVLYDQRRGVSLLASCPVPPTLLAWHPAGALVMAGSGQGELMCFDVGLAPVSMALLAEEVASAATLRLDQHLRCSGELEAIRWGTNLEGGQETDILMLAFHGGPLAALKFKLGGFLLRNDCLSFIKMSEILNSSQSFYILLHHPEISTSYLNSAFHSSWIAEISSLKSCSSILPSSNLKHFQQDLVLSNRSAFF